MNQFNTANLEFASSLKRMSEIHSQSRFQRNIFNAEQIHAAYQEAKAISGAQDGSREPSLEDFGLNEADTENVEAWLAKSGGQSDISSTPISISICVLLAGLLFLLFGKWDSGFGVVFLAAYVLIGIPHLLTTAWITDTRRLIGNIIHKDEVRRLEANSHRLKRFREVHAQYEARRKWIAEDFWRQLRGIDLEREMRELFGANGYHTQSTPRTGDGGIDLILSKNGRSTIVQCKGHGNPVGVAVVREMIGVLSRHPDTDAMIVSPSGFTKGAKDFAQGSPIRLIQLADIMAMQESISAEQPPSPDRR